MTDMTTITPTSLKARREAMGVSRELVAAFCPEGTTAALIAKQERAKQFNVFHWHAMAINNLEEWMARDRIAIIDQIKVDAERDIALIDGRPVIWHYSEHVFAEHCPYAEGCKFQPELYRVAMIDAREDLLEELGMVIDAEFLPDKFAQFIAEIGAEQDTPAMRAKWWRHWSKQFYMSKEG